MRARAHVFAGVMVAGVLAALAGAAPGCNRDSASGSGQPTVGVAFETLQTEFWVASFDEIRKELVAKKANMLEAVADNDPSRQLEQVNNFIAKKVDGIILAPKDKDTAMRMIEAANEAKVPIVLFNRPPRDPNAECTTIVADNKELTRKTVEYMVGEAKKRGRRHKAAVLIGDLGDENAVARKDGFYEAVKQHPDVVEVVSEIPTEWNQEKALAGISAALRSNSDIDFIFTSSDFMFPSIVSALKGKDKYKKVGDEGHVILGGFDGDATAYQMLADGYLDATGVQDMAFEAQQAVQAVLDMKAGKQVARVIKDSGFVIHQGNLQEMKPRMWGANVKKK
jgi:ABC-type sugar transport system substrate-binding protein